MFYKDKIERLEERVDYLEKGYNDLRRDLTNSRILPRYMNSPQDTTYSAISLEDLEKTQQKILKYLNIELKNTPSKTELVKKINKK